MSSVRRSYGNFFYFSFTRRAKSGRIKTAPERSDEEGHGRLLMHCKQRNSSDRVEEDHLRGRMWVYVRFLNENSGKVPWIFRGLSINPNITYICSTSNWIFATRDTLWIARHFWTGGMLSDHVCRYFVLYCRWNQLTFIQSYILLSVNFSNMVMGGLHKYVYGHKFMKTLFLLRCDL